MVEDDCFHGKVLYLVCAGKNILMASLRTLGVTESSKTGELRFS
jgi:hypothetical protein